MPDAPATQPLAYMLLANMLRAAAQMASDGTATRMDIDLAMRLGARHRQGPLELTAEIAPDRRRELNLLAPVSDAASSRDSGGPSATFGDGPVGVVGSGFMASGIVYATALAGQSVVMLARSEGRADAAWAGLAAAVDRAVARDRAHGQTAQAILGRITTTADLDKFRDSSLVIEAVAEDLDIKREIFTQLDRALPRTELLATNTSSLTVSDIAAATTRPERVGALHFFSPVAAMKLVEVVAPPRGDPALAGRASAWARSLGKVPVTSADRAGFIVNSLLIPFLNDVARAGDEGAGGCEELDDMMVTEFGHPMGPFALLDFIGLDVSLAAQEAICAADPGEAERLRPAASLREHVRAGRLGRKTGLGFYRYDNGKALA